MKFGLRASRVGVVVAACVALCAISCNKSDSGGANQPASAASASATAPVPVAQVVPTEAAPPADKTGGFDGARAYANVAKLVSFGPRPPDSPAIRQVQDYLTGELKSYGCEIDVDDFHASTPVGSVAMKNIIA
jgi:hypothetical protein